MRNKMTMSGSWDCDTGPHSSGYLDTRTLLLGTGGYIPYISVPRKAGGFEFQTIFRPPRCPDKRGLTAYGKLVLSAAPRHKWCWSSLVRNLLVRIGGWWLFRKFGTTQGRVSSCQSFFPMSSRLHGPSWPHPDSWICTVCSTFSFRANVIKITLSTVVTLHQIKHHSKEGAHIFIKVTLYKLPHSLIHL